MIESKDCLIIFLIILKDKLNMENNLNDGGVQQIPQKMRITAKEFAAKFSSKRECYTFLTIDCKAYLPHYDTVTIYFLKDLIAGSKKCKFSISSKY